MRNRRALSLLITLMMIVSMFAGTGLSAALAESAIKGVVQINTLDELKQALKSQNNVTLQLMKDIIGDGKSETCQVDGKTLTLDLNGHTLNASNYHSAIWVTGKAELTIVDSAGGGKITGGNATRGGGINVGDSAVVTFESGTITDNKASDQGGGVYVYGKGTFNMTGGVIEKNTASNQGGGIYNVGTVTANGATLRLNSTKSGSAGALFNNGTATLTDCVFKANTANTRGGAMLNEKGHTATLTNCVVTENYAATIDGGGIVNYGTLNVTGGEFSRNESWKSGGGIFLTQDSTATITGATFTGNVANEKGGAIMVRPNASCTLEDVTVTENHAADFGGGIDVENKPKAFNIKGTIVVKDNECSDKMGNDVYLGNTVTITQTGALTEGSQIGVHVSGNQNYAFVNGFTTYNKGEKPAKYYTAQEGFWVMSGDDGAEPYVWNSTWRAAQELIDDAPDGGTIVLDRDYTGSTADKYLSVTKNITIDLNGHTLDRGLKAIQSNGSAILVGAGGTLTIRDSAGGGKITGGASNDGGGIDMIAGTVNLEGGVITGNLANQGAGVYNNSRYGSLNISGGEITGNRANKIGGGVYIADGKSVNLTGGKITGNRAQEGGGVYSNAKSGGLSVQGAPVVNDNFAPSGSNIKLKSGAKIAVAGRLTDGALLDVSAEKTDGVLTRGLQASGSSLDVFTYNGNRGSVKPSLKDGELYVNVDVKADVWVSDWNGLQKAINSATNGQVIALSNDLKANGAGRIKVSGKTITIDLNGHAMDRQIGGPDTDGHVIEIVNGSKLTIRDGVGAGVIKGGYAVRGGGIYVSSGATLNFEGGSIVGNKAGAGGGIYVYGTLNMTGGAISGNTAVFVGTDALESFGAVAVGGGLFCDIGAKVNIGPGVIITDNTAYVGGGIASMSTLTMNGARVIANRIVDVGNDWVKYTRQDKLMGTFRPLYGVDRRGGGLIVFGGKAELTKCTFEDNEALNTAGGAGTYRNGEALSYYSAATLQLNDCVFTGNTAKSNGGAVYAGWRTTVGVSGGSYTNNYAPNGGGIMVAVEGTFKVHGGPVVKDNRAGSLRDGPDIFLPAKDDYQSSGAMITVDGKLTPEAEMNVQPGILIGTVTKDYKKYHEGEDPKQFFLPQEGSGVGLDANGEVRILSSDWSDLQREINAAEDGGTVTLNRTWSAGEDDEPLIIPAGKTVTLDLNGYSLYRGLRKVIDNGSAIIVEKGATLTIQDKTGKGQITGGASKYGGGIINHGTLNLEGGTITGNQSYYGGGIYNDDTLNISGGRIEKNTSNQGGGIYIETGELHITGGTIADNTANKSGGGLHLRSRWNYINNATITGNDSRGNGGGIQLENAQVRMGSVTVTGNKAALQGGGIYYADNCTLGIEGAMVVSDNTAASGHNIMMATGSKLGVTGAIADTARVDITTVVDTEAVLTDGLASSGHGAEGFTFNGNVQPSLKDGELYINLESKADVWVSTWDSLQDAVNKSTKDQVIALAADVTGNGKQSIKVDGKTVTLDLNGHTIDGKGTGSNSVLWISGGSRLTLRDTKGTGTVRGGKAGRGGAMNISEHSIVNVEGGAFTDNSASENGGAFYVYGTLNMTGGTISGNNATHRAGAIYIDEDARVTLSNVVIRSNSANHGGAIFVDEGRLDAENVRIADNTSVNYGGGGIYSDGTTTLKNCTITGNTCKQYWGGYGGGLFVQQSTTMNLTDCTITNNSGEYGGGVFVKGTANISGGTIRSNRSTQQGGGICVDGSNYPTLNLQGSAVVTDNASALGNNVYLPNKHYITFSGAMTEGAEVDVSLEKDWGVFTRNYATYHQDQDPNAYFTSIEGNPISLVNGEPYLGITDETREQSATTVVSANGVSSRNWMSGIPDERKLNEINIPGTHDSAMADVMKNFRFNFKLKNNAKMFTSYADNAITQYRHINQQLDEGFRIFDLRLDNMYEDTTSVLGMFDYVADHEDDGKNLWLVHGKTEDGGTVWAKGPDGNLVSLNKVLGWVKSFLEKHPSEVVILNVSAETKWDEEVKPTEKRLVKIMRAFSREINPSTGKPYLWTVDGDISKNATDYPTLGEVRGQVLLKGGGTGKNGLGNAICGSAGGKYVSRKVAGDYEYGDHSKVTFLTNFFNAYGNTPLPRNVHEHLNLVFDCGTNCAPKGWQGIPSSTPLQNANYVNDRVFSEGGVVDRKGYYIGWFTMDGGTAKEAAVIWNTNFFPMDYVTVTVDGGLSEQDLASGAFIPMEDPALRAINIPEEGAEASGNTEGTYTYRVLRGKEITVPESYYSYDAEAVERDFQSWQAVSADQNAIVRPGETLLLMEDTTLTGQWLGKGETSVEIVWQDAENADEFRPEQMEISVSVDDDPGHDFTATVKAEDGWKTVVNGDVKSVRPIWERVSGNEQGEDTAEGYRYEVGSAKADIGTEDAEAFGEEAATDARAVVVTMFHTPQRTIDASGAIQWNDDNDRDGLRPESVTLHLFRGEEELDSATVTAENGWAWSFGELPEFIDTQAVEYTITEDSVENYVRSINGLTVTNRHTPAVTNIEGGILWADSDNAAGTRPENVVLHLMADDEIVATLNVGVDGAATILMEITDNDEVEQVEAEAEQAEDEQAEDDGDGSEYDGTFVAPEEAESDEAAEETAEAEKTATEETATEDAATAEGLKSLTEWVWHFYSVPMYSAGNRINYTVVQEDADGYYNTLDTENGYLFTNALLPSQIDVTYDGNGGSGEMTGETLEPGAEYTLPENGFTAPEGMEFAGWQVNVEVDQAVTAVDAMLAELNATTEEKAEPEEAEAPEAAEEAVEAELHEPGEVMRLNGNATVIAQWQEAPRPIVITFDGNGAEGAMDDATPDEAGEYTLPENGFTVPEGMEFAGWTVHAETIEAEDAEEAPEEDILPEETYVDHIYQAGDVITITASTTVTAQWQEVPQPIAITFDGNGAEGAMEAATPDEEGGYILPENGFTVPEGMEFAGWKLRTDAPEAEASEEVVEETVEATETEIVEDGGMVFNPGDSIVVTADTTFVAQWKEIPTAIVITFYANGGEGEMEAATPDEDGHYTLPENGFTAPEDKEFIGWQVGEEAWQVGDEITVEEDVTILALWQYEGVLTVTFDANGGEGEMEAALTDREGNLTLPENEFIAPEGMEFAGWQIGEEVKQAGETITVTEAVTAVAQWQEAEAETEEAAPVAVSFDGNGAEGEMEPIVPDEEGNCELPESAFTAPEGTTFAGWQIGEEVKQAGETITVTEAVTAVAQWQEAEAEAETETEEETEAETETAEEAATVAVSFDGNGAEGEMEPIAPDEEGNCELPESAFTAPEGTTFAGWQIGEEVKQAGETITVTEAVTAVAQWQEAEAEAEETEETEETEAKPEGEENAETQPEGEAAEATETTEATEATETTQTRIVFFDENGGSGNMEQVTVEDQGVYTLPENGYTAPEGMTFAGWLIGEVIHQPGDQVTISEDTLIMAQWQSTESEATAEEAEAAAEATKEQTEAPAEATEEQTEAPAEATEEQTEAPAEVTEEQTEALAEAAEEQTEAPAEVAEEQTEAPAEVTEEQIEAPAEVTEEQTEALAEAAEEQTEAPAETTEEQTEAPAEATEEQTEAPAEATEEEQELVFGTEEEQAEQDAGEDFTADDLPEEVPAEAESEAAAMVSEEIQAEAAPVEEPAAEEPVTEEPAAEEPVAEEPAAEEVPADTTEAEQPAEPAANYTVSFDGGGADGAMEAVQVTGGSEYTLPNPGYTIEGATFDRWEISGNGEAEPFVINAGETLIVGGDITATAVWAFSEEGEVLEAGTEEVEETADVSVEGDEFEADETEAVAAEDTEAIVEGEGETEENAEPEVVDAPSATGTAVSGTGIAAIVTAVVLLVAAAAFAILKKKKKH